MNRMATTLCGLILLAPTARRADAVERVVVVDLLDAELRLGAGPQAVEVALAEVVEVGDPAAVAVLARRLAARAVERDPGVDAVAGGVRGFATVLRGATSFLDKVGGGPRSALSSTDFGGVAPYYDPTGWGGS